MDVFLIIISFISVFVAIIIQVFENIIYIKHIKISNWRKITGGEVARFLLDKHDLKDVKVKEVNSYLTDRYDFKKKEVQLSKKVYNSATIGAVAIASREVYNAILEKERPYSRVVKKFLVFISNLSFPISYLTIILSIIFNSLRFIQISIVIESILLFLQVIILAIKINDSKMILKELDYSHLLNNQELSKSKEVLNSTTLSSIAKINTLLLYLFGIISLIGEKTYSISPKILSYFWIFILSCFLGFVVETIWCLIRNGKIESRKGVIYEPFIPIYGISGLLILMVIEQFHLFKNFEIFIVGFIISTIVEFVSSLFQEKVFATKSWDYRNFLFNLGGRVNLLYSILFGLISLVSYKLILHPLMNMFMELKITSLIISLTLYRLVYMLYDFIISFIAAYRMKERRKGIKRDNIFWNYIDEKYSDDFLKTIYANMVNVEFKNKNTMNYNYEKENAKNVL